MFNTSPPRDYKLWEEICYRYTLHLVERYGIETVSKWHLHCFNEPDIPSFFLSELPRDEEGVKERVKAYCPLYRAFEKGIRRVSDKLVIGGPALSNRLQFLRGFLDYVRENDLKLDYIALHDYGTSPKKLNEGTVPLAVKNSVDKLKGYLDVIREKGFDDREIVLDEWGASSAGFYNREECPQLMFRETEVFSAYFVRFISEIIRAGYPVSKMLICLSGQHEMTEDFSGFRNFFTLNFIKKPIYNAYILASKLGDTLLDHQEENPDIAVIPTRNEKGERAVLIAYCAPDLSEEIPDVTETLRFAGGFGEKHVTAWCIDRDHTNPYRLWKKMGEAEIAGETLARLREEGNLKPVPVQTENGAITLPLTANAVWLVTLK